MTLTIFGATGTVGKQLVANALQKGHVVKAFGRNIEELLDEDIKNANLIAIKGYVFDEKGVYKAIKGSDAVLSTLGGAFDGSDKTRSLGMKNITIQMKKAGVKRIIALGGMGVLNGDDRTILMDKPGYPQEYLPVGREHLQAFKHLEESGLVWTFVGSPDIVNAPATNNFVTEADVMPSPATGKITAGDLALFMLREVEDNKYPQQKVGISN